MTPEETRALIDHLDENLTGSSLGNLERLIAELGPETKTIATGGLAKLIASGCKHIGAVDEMLTLNGLRLIWERNHDRHRRR